MIEICRDHATNAKCWQVLERDKAGDEDVPRPVELRWRPGG
jgi:hypothetical protein